MQVLQIRGEEEGLRDIIRTYKVLGENNNLSIPMRVCSCFQKIF